MGIKIFVLFNQKTLDGMSRLIHIEVINKGDTQMTHTNIGRTVEIGAGSEMTKGTVVAEHIKTVRGRERTFFTIRRSDGFFLEQDARYTNFAWEFVPANEALAELCLDEAIDARLGLK